METFVSITGLGSGTLLLCLGAIFFAGVVRGFSGFALSAMVMATLAAVLSPAELIPICWFMELSASLVLMRSGWRDARRAVANRIILGGLIGVPIGLLLTTSAEVTTSRTVALSVLSALTALQIANVQVPWLATKSGTYATGLVAGFATGVAWIGGMVVALFVLAQNAPPREMRATLIYYLLMASVPSIFYLVGFGLMTEQALIRAAVFVPVALCGVFAGRLLFRPSLEQFYKRFCLWLLLALAGAGLSRTL